MEYQENCNLNFDKEKPNAKNLLTQYDTETIKKMIDVLVHDYDKYWNNYYKRPGLFMLYVKKMNWLRDQVLEIVDQNDQEEAEMEKLQEKAEEAKKIDKSKALKGLLKK